MERPPQHVTQTESFNILAQTIPSQWIIRDISPDYGLDKSIEVVDGQKVTGKEVLVQVKGTNAIDLKDGYVSFNIEVDKLKYYLERESPVILTVVDIPTKKCYWLFVQEYIYESLDIANPNWRQQETVTIKIPEVNELSSTLTRFKGVAQGGTTYLVAKRLEKIPIEYLAHWETNFQSISKLEEVADKFLQKQFEIKFAVSYRCQKENDYEKATNVLMEIANQAKATNPVIYCKAILSIAYGLNPFSESKEIFQLLQSIKEQVDILENTSIQIMWESEYLETCFAKLMKNMNSYRMMFAVASHAPQGTMAPYIGVQISNIINGLYEIEKEFIKLLDKAIENREVILYLDLLRRLLKMQFLLCYNSSLESKPATIYSQVESIKKSLISALQPAKKFSKDIVFEIYLDLAHVCGSVEDITSRDKYLGDALELAKQLQHKGFLNGVQTTQEHLKRSQTIPTIIKVQEAEVRIEDVSDETEEKVAKKLLEVAGIDFDSDDELARMAKIGLKDRNPERILKYCEHLYTEVVIYGPIWEMVGLPTTGMKILFCEKKGVSVMGYELDALLDDMKKDCCSPCKDLCPIPSEWKWTHEWHRKRGQPELMKTIMRNFLRS